MGVVLPAFLWALALGRTFNLINYQVGNDLVFGNLHREGQLEEKDSFASLYKIIESSKDVQDFLGADARFAIESKVTGLSSRIASFIKSAVKPREKLVEIMINSVNVKGLEKIPYQNVSDTWQTKDPKKVGTHYIKQFEMGGQFITTISFSCKDAEHKERVLKAVKNNLSESGTVGKDFTEKIEHIKKELGTDYVDYRIGEVYCAGCDIKKFPMFYNLKKLIQVATELPNMVKTANSDYVGYGTRITMELEELSTISSDFPAYKENSEVIEKLGDVNKMFDDVNIAYNEAQTFDSLLPYYVDNKELAEFYGELKKYRRVISVTVINLDISPSASVSQFDEIYKVYGPTDDYQRYQKRFRALRDKIKKDIEG